MRAVPVGWSRAAREDLLEIYVAIGLGNVHAAERLYDRIEARARILSARPRLGPRRSDVRPGLRVLVDSPYLIFYETVPDTDIGSVQKVEIVRVVDGRRDLKSLF